MEKRCFRCWTSLAVLIPAAFERHIGVNNDRRGTSLSSVYRFNIIIYIGKLIYMVVMGKRIFIPIHLRWKQMVSSDQNRTPNKEPATFKFPAQAYVILHWTWRSSLNIILPSNIESSNHQPRMMRTRFKRPAKVQSRRNLAIAYCCLQVPATVHMPLGEMGNSQWSRCFIVICHSQAVGRGGVVIGAIGELYKAVTKG